MLLCKELRLNEPTFLTGDSPKPHSDVLRRSCSVRSGMAWALLVPSGFNLFFSLSQFDAPVLPRAFVQCSPLGLSILPSAGVTSLTSAPCRQPDLGVCSIKNEPLPPEVGVIFKILKNFFPKKPSPSEWSKKIFLKFFEIKKKFEWIIILINQLKAFLIFIMKLNSENLIVQHNTSYFFPNYRKILI